MGKEHILFRKAKFYWGVMSSCPAGSMAELQRVYDDHHSQLEKNGHELGEVGVSWLVLIVSYVMLVY